MSLRVQGIKEKTVEIRPIAGTKPRGIVNGKIDPDLDSRYETELKIDAKELAEHTMLIDLARNDVARISRPGTRVVDEPFIVEKYSHVQHLVSNVKGTLKPGLDALHAYLASMNMGTLTGAPKVEAMKLLRKFERTKRGFYGGAVGYLTPHKDFDSTIIIRSMRLKEGKAYVRAGAGIVLDSIPEKEFEETEKKAAACLAAIRQAGGRR
jgi:anthranilate synthase component 1